MPAAHMCDSRQVERGRCGMGRRLAPVGGEQGL